MSLDNCGNCRFVRKATDRLGTCRRHAPSPMIIGMSNDRLGNPAPMVDGFFPPVRLDVWCGDYERQVIGVPIEINEAALMGEPEGNA